MAQREKERGANVGLFILIQLVRLSQQNRYIQFLTKIVSQSISSLATMSSYVQQCLGCLCVSAYFIGYNSTEMQSSLYKIVFCEFSDFNLKSSRKDMVGSCVVYIKAINLKMQNLEPQGVIICISLHSLIKTCIGSHLPERTGTI